jgi:hypothetical protein
MDCKLKKEENVNIFDGMWIALFFLVSGVMGALFGHREKKAREKKIEFFKYIPGISEEKNHR